MIETSFKKSNFDLMLETKKIYYVSCLFSLLPFRESFMKSFSFVPLLMAMMSSSVFGQITEQQITEQQIEAKYTEVMQKCNAYAYAKQQVMGNMSSCSNSIWNTIAVIYEIEVIQLAQSKFDPNYNDDPDMPADKAAFILRENEISSDVTAKTNDLSDLEKNYNQVLMECRSEESIEADARFFRNGPISEEYPDLFRGVRMSRLTALLAEAESGRSIASFFKIPSKLQADSAKAMNSNADQLLTDIINY